MPQPSKEDLIRKLPQSRKLELLGHDYIHGITNYHEQYTTQEIDIEELMLAGFDKLLLESNKFIETLKLFAEEELDTILEAQPKNLQAIRQGLVQHLQIIQPIPENAFSPPPGVSECLKPLHDFQERMRRKVINEIFDKKRRFLVQMPTGAGKTRTACEIVIDFVRLNASNNLFNENLKILWVAQSNELCVQAYETFRNLYSLKGTTDITIGHFYGSNEIHPSIVDQPAIIFCSIQKLLKNYGSDLWKEIKEQNYLVVVDEAHRSIAAQWVKALNYFTENAGVYLIGLTATPGGGNLNSSHDLATYYHSNKISVMNEYYEEIAHPIRYLTDLHFLAEIERYEIHSNIKVDNAISESNSWELTFLPSTIRKLAVDPSRNASIKNIVEENSSKKILIFSCSIEHNQILKDILKYHNYDSEIVDAETERRDIIIEKFKTGGLNILINYGVLTTGFDAPNTDVCIIARPVNSIVMYSQMVGRILRGSKNIANWNGPGNKVNKLYTIKDNLNHGDYDALYNSFNNFWN